MKRLRKLFSTMAKDITEELGEGKKQNLLWILDANYLMCLYSLSLSDDGELPLLFIIKAGAPQPTIVAYNGRLCGEMEKIGASKYYRGIRMASIQLQHTFVIISKIYL